MSDHPTSPKPPERSIASLEEIASGILAQVPKEKRGEIAVDISRLAVQGKLEEFKSIVEAAQAGIRWIIMISGGAAVSLLAFLGHLATTPESRHLIAGFAWSLLPVVASTLLGAIASGIFYLSLSADLVDKHAMGRAMTRIMLILIALSYGLFGLGSYLAFCGFRAMSN